MLLKVKTVRIDFDNNDFLNAEDYINLTGISRDQFDDTCAIVVNNFNKTENIQHDCNRYVIYQA